MIRIAALIALIAAAGAEGACIPVEGERIRIGDLASAVPAFAGADPQRPVGFAPAPGVQRVMTTGEIARLASDIGLRAVDAAPVCFERKKRPLSEDEIIAAIRGALPGPGIAVHVVERPPMELPPGALEFEPAGLLRPPVLSAESVCQWRGRLTYSPGKTMPVFVKVRLAVMRRELVAVEDLPAGKPIGVNQVRLEEIAVNPFAEGSAGKVDDVAGWIPRRNLPAGGVVVRSAVTPPVVIERGAAVTVEAQVGGAYLKVAGRAESSGRAGDLIAVTNVNSGKHLRARVLRAGWVRVE